MAKNTSNSLVPSRVERIAKKTASIGTGRVKAEKMPHDITVSGIVAQEIQGFIVEITESHLSLRHKAKSGSSKQVVTTFPMANVIERVGVAGEAGQVTVLTHSAIRELKGQYVTVKGNEIIATDVQNGETTVFNNNIPGITIHLQVDETVAAKKYGYEAGKGDSKKSSKSKAEKPAKGKAKKSKKSDEGF